MSFLFYHKRVSLVVFILIFTVSCQSIKTRSEVARKKAGAKPVAAEVTVPATKSTGQEEAPLVSQSAILEAEGIEEKSAEIENDVSVAPPPPAPVIPPLPKIGIILGPGGAKAYAHIGFLREISRSRLPVHAIGGIEFGSPIAALYANKEQANEVEWQMFKLREDLIKKKTFLGESATNIDFNVMKDFLSSSFYKMKAEDFRLPFACPSLNLKKNQVYLMNRGSMEQVIALCMTYPPFFKPYQDSIAGIREVASLASYLRSKGANHVVLVNVLEAPNGVRKYVSEESDTNNLIWNEIAATYNGPIIGVDTIISLETRSYSIVDFDKRREIMNKGAESTSGQVRQLMQKLGL